MRHGFVLFELMIWANRRLLCFYEAKDGNRKKKEREYVV